MAYAVAAIVKKDGKPYVDMAAVSEAPAGTFFWVSLATNCPKSDNAFCPSAVSCLLRHWFPLRVMQCS